MRYTRRCVFLGASASLCFGSRVLAAPERYRLDANRSIVGFTYRVNGNKARGVMPVQDAMVELDLNHVPNSTVSVDLSIKKARAGDGLATTAMKSADVLNARSFPVARFQSHTVKGSARNASIEGDLTLRGVTRPISLSGYLVREPDAPLDNSELFIRVSGSIRRSEFGAKGFSGFVGDKIGLEITVKLIRI